MTQKKLFELNKPKRADPELPKEVLHGMYYEKDNDIFVVYHQGRRGTQWTGAHFAEEFPKHAVDRIKKERSI